MDNRPVVIGVGASDIVRRSESTALKFALDAAVAALADAGLQAADIDGLVTCSVAPNLAARHDDGVDEVSLLMAANALGLKKLKFALDTQVMAGSMVVAAAQAVATGACRRVLIVRAMYNDAAVRYSSADVELAGGPSQYTLPYGLGPGGGRFALWLRRYMHLHGATRRDLYAIVKAARRHAAMNEKAYWRNKTLSFEEYMAAKWICEPLSIYDCDIPVCGAGAMVIAHEPAARDLGRAAAYINGWSTQDHVAQLLASRGLKPGDIAVAQIYDGFSSFVLFWLERLGFCAEGEASRFIRDGGIEIDGTLAVNTFGGSLGEGRLHGMGHFREGVLQAMGRAGARQVTKKDGVGLVQVGIPENSWILLLGSEPRT